MQQEKLPIRYKSMVKNSTAARTNERFLEQSFQPDLAKRIAAGFGAVLRTYIDRYTCLILRLLFPTQSGALVKFDFVIESRKGEGCGGDRGGYLRKLVLPFDPLFREN